MMQKSYANFSGIRLGIDIGGTGIKAGAVSSDHQILGRAVVPTCTQRPWQAVVQDTAKAARLALKDAGADENQCLSVGIGCPGIISAKTGTVIYSNNLGWKDVPLIKALEKTFSLPLFVSNDANCAVLGEACAGAAKGCRNVVLLTLGTGIGSGILTDGRLLEGGGPGGAEFGHTLLVMDGEPCTCGRRGCFESYASASALIRQAKRAAEKYSESLLATLCKRDLARMNGHIPFLAARLGDPTGLQVVQQYTTYLAAGIANAVNIFRPEAVLLSGGISKEGTYLTNPLEKLVAKEVFGRSASFLPKIRTAALGNNAGIIGAANLASVRNSKF
ncbi:MAG: ROK family protein [Oscillospiraceae bacterium]|nr:ROK family protein [Oscillospiraceae bacterium]